MSCISEAWHGHDHFSTCTYHWIVDPQVYQNLGSYFSATVIFITFLATIWTTRSNNRTNTFIDFTKTFSQFMDERQNLIELSNAETDAANTTQQTTAPTVSPRLQAKVLEYYGRFYGFQFSEYYAYKARNLDRTLFTLWMRSRWREFHANRAAPENQLHGIDHHAGWNHWRRNFHRGATDDYTRLMDSLLHCEHEYQVPGLVIKHGPGPWPLPWLSWLIRASLNGLWREHIAPGWERVRTRRLTLLLLLTAVVLIALVVTRVR
jgi:hypothetical protein